MKKQGVAILGSTGSVGVSTLDVIELHREKFEVYALTANINVETMFEQCRRFLPSEVAMADSQAAQQLSDRLASEGLDHINVTSGSAAISAIASSFAVDSVMSAIVGAAGLLPTLAAVRAGKRVMIANKEPLVMTGDLFMREAADSGATILPIDSEHNAVFQCLPADNQMQVVSKVHLTASGGPFFGRRWADLASITPDQACAHPNWSMGRKISVDSATMMNKGLELIEASALFSLPAEQVDILIHPQSIVHSLVEYCDGTFLAQMGAPDMRIPIAYALAWPSRFASGAATLNLAEIAQLEFFEPDMKNLPCLSLARQAAEVGGSAPAILNAANEVAVEAFLSERITFIEIPTIIEYALENISQGAISSVSDVLNIDNEARARASEKLDSSP